MTDLLSVGLSGIRAASASLRMVGENIANADDPAYVRRRVQLGEAAMPVRGSPLYKTQVATPGVDIIGVGRSVDPLADAALRRADSAAAQTGQRADWLARIEGALGDGAQGIGARMTAFFAAGTRASAQPNDQALRLEMLSGLDRVSSGFTGAATRLEALDSDLTGSLQSAATSLTTDLATLASVNRDLRGARPGSAAQAQLLDRRDAALRSVTAALPAEISLDRHGAATLSVGGVTLTTATTSEALTASRTPTGGVALMTTGGTAVSLSGGTWAGLNQAGEAIRAQRADLDTQAAQFVSSINNWNAGGQTPSGTGGSPLLGGSTAASITLITQDPSAIAAATPGGNPAGNLLALDTLRGGTGSEATWAMSVNRTATATRAARADMEAAQLFADHAAAARDQISGVDLDREAAEMLRLQQAYGAAARVLQTARETVQTILDIV